MIGCTGTILHSSAVKKRFVRTYDTSSYVLKHGTQELSVCKITALLLRGIFLYILHFEIQVRA